MRAGPLALVLAGLAAPSLAAAAPAAPEPWLRVETRPCYGVCPVYTLTVLPGGRVRFQGKRFVILKGAHQRSMTRAEVAELEQAITRSGFADLGTDCCNCVKRTDQAWTILTITTGGATRTIEHYHGCPDAPPAIPALEDAISKATRARQWIGSDQQRARRKWTRSHPDR